MCNGLLLKTFICIICRLYLSHVFHVSVAKVEGAKFLIACHRTQFKCICDNGWCFFNIFSNTCLERLTKILKGAFQFFHSSLIMAPLKNRWKQKQINKIVPKRGDILELPVGSLVWGRLASSPWWPGMCKCVSAFLCYLYRAFSCIPYFNQQHTQIKIQ
jgi:hypothetical protein